MKPELTASRLRELLHYDPETCIFTRRVRNPSRYFNREQVGNVVASSGYVRISVDGRQYQAHRLAFLFMSGDWPAAGVDHRNGVRDDNRWENLRAATAAQNMQNNAFRSDNTSGFTGVTWNRRSQKWQSQIKAGGKNKVLGEFADIRDAEAAYRDAKPRFHPFEPEVVKRRCQYRSRCDDGSGVSSC